MERVKRKLKRFLPDFVLRVSRDLGLIKLFIPKVGNVRFGDFSNPFPFSDRFGYNRGGPVDRYYIEKFLQAESHLIKGDVLEIGDNDYTLRFGKNVKSHVLHYKEGNTKATYVGDLGNSNTLPDVKFDCIILTQTLQFIYDYKTGIKNAFDLLKSEGTLLITVPGITPIDKGEFKTNWLWSFTKNGIDHVLKEILPNEEIKTEAYGNVYTASCFLYGIGLPELESGKLDIRDESYEVIITMLIKKS